jgi:hypothetical protein
MSRSARREPTGLDRPSTGGITAQRVRDLCAVLGENEQNEGLERC